MVSLCLPGCPSPIYSHLSTSFDFRSPTRDGPMAKCPLVFFCPLAALGLVFGPLPRQVESRLVGGREVVEVGGPQRASGGSSGATLQQRTTLRILLPEDATLRIDGKKFSGKGKR